MYTIKHGQNGQIECIVCGEMSIPHDERNRDYQKYLAWVADGNTAEIMEPEPVAQVLVLTPLQILSRMTPQEQTALLTSTDIPVLLTRNLMIAALEVRSDDLRTAEGMQVFINAGIFTAERAAVIYS